ncbi:ruBisCO-associated protein-like [Prosopis cineraria]|uniref:ruBisCO-associated protein-like n=1 Tax=Prosopis cineraria TaxID=364024 RepID=UPI002410A676|nr:ruBisCO-associated protein-like [Prosopis cineraria]
MSNPLLSYRVYASSNSSIENLQPVRLKNGIQVALAFARDYDSSGKSTGEFDCYFNKSDFTEAKIKAFKDKANSKVKFFLSIGGRDQKYGFSVTSSEKESWISSATKYLKKIIEERKLDGLDVYYQHIHPDGQGQFKDAIGEVIETLKNELPDDFLVSITVSASLCDNYYWPLYRDFKDSIDFVVYQTHTWPTVIRTSLSLKEVLDKLPYDKKKLIAGHSSTHPSDWTTVPVPIFLGAVPHLLDQKPATASGISKWIVTGDDNPEK